MADTAEQVTATLVELADTLLGDYNLLDYLNLLLERSVALLVADAGGVMLALGESPTTLRLVTSTDEHPHILELFELHEEGAPCFDCHELGEPVIETDLSRTDRWPTFAAAALKCGYRSVYAFPMSLRGEQIGALKLFARRPDAALADISSAQAFADMATIGIMQHRAVNEARQLAGQLQTALHSRVVIEQAKGMLAERLDCELDEAYQMIRWYGRHHNRLLREVASAVVAGTLSAHELVHPKPSPE